MHCIWKGLFFSPLPMSSTSLNHETRENIPVKFSIITLWSGLERCLAECLSKQILIKGKTPHHPVALPEPAFVLVFIPYLL